MKQIEAYSFRNMVYEGKSYTSDLIIYPGRVDPSWWRLKGHVLQLEDQGIELWVEKTGKAVKTFNAVAQGKKVIGAFHLTC